jgi:hypothetical protein
LRPFHCHHEYRTPDRGYSDRLRQQAVTHPIGNQPEMGIDLASMAFYNVPITAYTDRDGPLHRTMVAMNVVLVGGVLYFGIISAHARQI